MEIVDPCMCGAEDCPACYPQRNPKHGRRCNCDACRDHYDHEDEWTGEEEYDDRTCRLRDFC